MKTLFTFFFILCLASVLNAQTISCNESELTSDWHVIGPVSYATNDLGRVTAMYVDPANTDIIVAGTRGSGIWRTTDGGDNWVSITGLQIPALGIISIAGKNGLLYATARFQGSDISMYNAGLIVSVDNGITWSYVSSLPAEIVFEGSKMYGPRIYFSDEPGNYDLYLCVRNKLFRKPLVGLWVTLADLNSFGTDSDHEIHEVDFDPTDYTRFILSPVTGKAEDLIFTEDNGVNWTSLPTPDISAFIPTGGTYSLYCSTSIPDGDFAYTIFKFEIYNDIGGHSSTKNFLVKYDLSFTPPTSDDVFIVNMNNKLYEAITGFNVLNFTSTQIGILGTTQNFVQKSMIPENSGGGTIPINFSDVSGETQCHIDIRDLNIRYNTTLGDYQIYIAHDGGMSRCDDILSLDADDDWEIINGTGLHITEFEGFDNSEYGKYIMAAGAPDGNNFVSNYSGSTNEYKFRWARGGDGFDAKISKIEKTDPAKVLFNKNGKGVDAPSVFAAHDFDDIDFTPSVINTPKVPKSAGTPDDEEGVHNFALKPYFFEKNETILWAGTSDVFRNTDPFRPAATFNDWDVISNTYFTIFPFPDHEISTLTPITAFDVVDDAGADIIYTYYTTKGLLSIDDPVKIIRSKYNYLPATPELIPIEVTPTSIFDDIGNNQFEHSWVTDLVIDKRNPDRVWICFGGNDLNTIIPNKEPGSSARNKKLQGRVYFTANGGTTWSNTSAGLPDYPVLSLEYWEGSDDIIFAGTDVGVFVWNASEQEWECFNTNLPYGSVNDLDINYCTMSLRAAVYGYGIWETPLPLGTHFSRPGAPALEITSDITWTQSNDVGRDIRIKPGATLTIQNCEIRMPKEHRIIVERGAALILDSATLINYCEPWSGIEVWGNTSKPHPLVANVIAGTYPSALDDQGVVYLKNESKIVNAETGISTYKTTPEGNDAVYNGGIIIAEDASFINNQLVMRFMPYDYPVGGAYDTDDDNISYFKNCVFNINSAYLFDNYSNYQVFLWDVDGIDFLGCDFTNELLQADVTERGEAIYSVDATYTVSNFCTDPYSPCEHFDDSQFSGFFRAIEAANTKYLPLDITITHNLFENNQRGILLSNVQNSSVFLNNLYVPDHASVHNYGGYLEQSQGYRVEENNFKPFDGFNGASPYNTGLYVGNNSNAVTQIYKNDFSNLETGIRSQTLNKRLQIKCNTFSDIDFFNLYVTSGELDNQGKCLNASYPLPDRVQAPAGNEFTNDVSPQGDIRVLSTAQPFIYRHHIDLPPVWFTTSKVTLDQCNIYSYSDNPCPSYLEGSGSAAMMMSMAGEIQDVMNTITSEIDAAEMFASEFTVEELEADLSIFESEKEYYTTQAVDLYITEQKPDSAIAVLQNEEAQWAQQRLVEVFMLTGDYENAEAQLKTLPTDEPAALDFVLLMEVMINMHSNGRTLDSLTEKELAIIESLHGKQSPSGVAAENILQLINKTDIPEVFDAEEAEDMRFANTETTTAIKVFPNPADNTLFIDLTAINETAIPVHIVFYNLTGNKIFESEFQAGAIRQMALNNFSAGIYLLQCFQENVLLHAEKVVVE